MIYFDHLINSFTDLQSNRLFFEKGDPPGRTFRTGKEERVNLLSMFITTILSCCFFNLQ